MNLEQKILGIPLVIYLLVIVIVVPILLFNAMIQITNMRILNSIYTQAKGANSRGIETRIITVTPSPTPTPKPYYDSSIVATPSATAQ